MTDTDKTGATVEVSAGDDRFVVAVDGRAVGFAQFVMHDRQRIFTHTEVDDAFEGRGLATILVRRALEATHDAGLRIVAVCPLIAAFLGKHHDFDEVLDPVSPDVKRFLSQH